MTTTTDEDALLAAIITNPNDDTPRLVYADWLDETAGGVPCGRCKGKGWVWVADGPYGYDRCREPCDGCSGTGTVPNHHADRAEFIRVQCELARVNEWCDHTGANGFCRCATCDHWNKLWRRERELWGDPADRTRMLGTPDWMLLTIVPSNIDRLSAGWRALGLVRRGFVEEVRCSAADWLAHADALAWHPDWTDECPHGKGKCNIPPWCRHCRDANGLPTGRVPRPLHPTAQPIRRVTLTAMVEPERVQGDGSGQRWRLPGRTAVYQPSSSEWQVDILLALCRREWDGITFERAE